MAVENIHMALADKDSIENVEESKIFPIAINTAKEETNNESLEHDMGMLT